MASPFVDLLQRSLVVNQASIGRAKQILMSTLAVVLGSSFFLPVSHAEILMEKGFKQLIPIRILTSAATATTVPGDSFNVRIIDDVKYGDKTLPAGSMLKGIITESKEPQRWGRPAHLKVTFEELSLGYLGTQGDSMFLEAHPNDKHYQATFLQDSLKTRKSLFSRQAIVGITANAITVPVSLISKQGALVAYALDEFVDATVGAIHEVKHKVPNDERSTGKKVFDGVIRGTTPIPLVVGFTKKGKNITYDEGSLTYFKFPEKLMQDIFTKI